MGQVHSPMAFGILVTLGMGVAEHVVAVEVVGINSLAVATDG